MDDHLTYEESKKVVIKGLILLGVVTLIEVGIALVGNGHLIHGFYLPKWIMYPVMIALSLYKAYYIISYFMHMKYEVRGLAMSVLLPAMLLIWAIIAFLQEGGSWGNRRQLIQDKNQEKVEETSNDLQGMLLRNDTYRLDR